MNKNRHSQQQKASEKENRNTCTFSMNVNTGLAFWISIYTVFFLSWPIPVTNYLTPVISAWIQIFIQIIWMCLWCDSVSGLLTLTIKLMTGILVTSLSCNVFSKEERRKGNQWKYPLKYSGKKYSFYFFSVITLNYS